MHDMYQEHILEHAKYPRNFGALEHPTHASNERNPLCGDELQMEFDVQDGMIKDVRFRGKGCAISQAAASMLTELLVEKSLDEARQITKHEVLDLLGIPIGPMRLKCALLSLKALKSALYLGELDDDELAL